MDIKIILLIGFFVFIVAGGGIFLFILQKGTKKKVEESKGPSAAPNSSQSFLPFEDISDSMIILPNHEYRMVVECNSINYFLKTEDEQNAVELSFRRFLNSMKFPFTFYIQTREIDNSEIVNNLKRNSAQVLKTFPQLKNYADIYTQELSSINDRLHNSKYKKKFIIVTYDEAGRMTHLNDEEKKNYALDELINRCRIVVGGLSNIGIKSRILKTDEVANMVYQSLHKEVGGISQDMMDGSYMSLSVNGKVFNSPTPSANIDSIILEFENKLNVEILNNPEVGFHHKEVASRLVKDAEKLRDFAGGYFRKSKGVNFDEE